MLHIKIKSRMVFPKDAIRLFVCLKTDLAFQSPRQQKATGITTDTKTETHSKELREKAKSHFIIPCTQPIQKTWHLNSSSNSKIKIT